MPKLKQLEIDFLKEIFSYPQGSGYVFNFSDRTISYFFGEEFNLDIHDAKYQSLGTSKAKKVIGLLEAEPGNVGAKVLRVLWDHRAAMLEDTDAEDKPQRAKKYFEIVQRFEGSADAISTDALEKFAENETLDELIEAIKRDIAAKKPEAAIDRLHTYCMKKFAHLVKQKGGLATDDVPLHARAGMYIKALEVKGQLHGMSLKIMKSSISVFEDFNHARNNKSLAHDNELLGNAEARYIFESVFNLLRLIRTIEAAKFGE